MQCCTQGRVHRPCTLRSCGLLCGVMHPGLLCGQTDCFTWREQSKNHFCKSSPLSPQHSLHWLNPNALLAALLSTSDSAMTQPPPVSTEKCLDFALDSGDAKPSRNGSIWDGHSAAAWLSHVALCCVVSHHTTSHHITRHHITSHHIMRQQWCTGHIPCLSAADVMRHSLSRVFVRANINHHWRVDPCFRLCMDKQKLLQGVRIHGAAME